MDDVPDLDPAALLARATQAAGIRRVGAEVRGLRRLEGGVSSLTYASSLVTDQGERPIVVKVAPPGLAPVRNRDVLRQARALAQVRELPDFPVPAVLFEDAGEPPEVPPLFAMELRPGQSYEPLLDVADDPPSASTAAERMRVAARTLAVLQSRTPTQLGVQDEPSAPVVEELERWQRLFATVDPDIGAGHEKLYERLIRAVPLGTAPRMLHGDYRLANMLFTDARLDAVIDWEIWSVGDPRSDLAWLLMHTRAEHVFHEERSPADVAAGSALPAPAELLEEYAVARRGLGASPEELRAVIDDLAWFLGVCYYKVASTVAVIYKRERRRERPDPKLIVAAAHLENVLAAGHRALDGG